MSNSNKGEVSAATESALLKKGAANIRPEDVLGLDKVTESYLCEPAANVYAIDFTKFITKPVQLSQCSSKCPA